MLQPPRERSHTDVTISQRRWPGVSLLVLEIVPCELGANDVAPISPKE